MKKEIKNLFPLEFQRINKIEKKERTTNINHFVKVE